MEKCIAENHDREHRADDAGDQAPARSARSTLVGQRDDVFGTDRPRFIVHLRHIPDPLARPVGLALRHRPQPTPLIHHCVIEI